ncbi:dihydrolipoyl dehydrogenase [Eubacterium aggregans]|uniref:dihydrolipoyl dehydrogenase n=1 Tax=Eubacterium aggregans TaxID=81409 RepID=UPI003F3A7CCB
MKVTVIGAGPGGYEAAIMAAKCGTEVTVIEKDQVGGTCLNRGCIPTKAFLAATDVLDAVKNAGEFGITTGEYSVDYSQILARKNKVKDSLIKGIEALFKQNKVTLIHGIATLKDSHTVVVEGAEGTQEIETDKIILATGSAPVCPGMFKYDGKTVITSDEILDLDVLPASIIIVGGGVIGCEIGQFLRRLGVEITIVEALSQILPNMDKDVSKQLARQLKKEKVKIVTGVGVQEVDVSDAGVKATLANGKVFEAEKMLVSIGRRSYTDALNAAAAGVEMDERGRIVVNDKMETSVPGIYAIGDIIATAQLAHVASKEGIVAAENACGADKAVDCRAVPGCVYTDPEVASVGLTEAECVDKGITIHIGTFDFRMLGKAQAIGKIQGFVKIITNDDDVIIGAAVVGPHATDLLAELSLAVHCRLTAAQVGDVIHPHPSLSEALMEAIHDVHGKSVHK